MISAWVITLLRALIIALAVTCFSKILSSGISYLKGRSKLLALALLMIPLIIPPLIPAYAYSAFSFNFQTKPVPNEILYFLIMTSRLIPIAVLILLIIPPAVSKSAVHCAHLLKTQEFSHHQIHQHLIIAFLSVFLFAFNEYEIASLMRTKHWTVTLFNAHAGGLVMNLSGSFQMALFPALTSVGAIALITTSFKRDHFSGSVESQKPGKLFFTSITASSFIGWLIPITIILLNSFDGFADALKGKWMKNEFFNSMLISIISTGCCLAIITGLLRLSKKLTMIFLIPGFFGALILGLLFIYIFNIPFLSPLKQTVLPLSLALILYSAPMAVLMILYFKKSQIENEQQVLLLPPGSQKEIKWLKTYVPWIMLSIPVFSFVWFDLTLSSMLAPASFTSVFPRIYNLMHYSENEKLSATVLITALLPLILYICIFLLSRLTLKTFISRSVK